MSRKPDFRVGALNKVTDRKNRRIGAAWINPDGSITVVLDDFIVIQGGADLVITLFKGDKHEEDNNLSP